MLNKDASICEKIIDHCESIESDIKENNSKEAFVNKRSSFQSVCFSLLQIGEALRMISYDFVDTHPYIPIKNIRGLRNRILYGYGPIDADMIWDIATTDIPVLKKQLTDILNDFIKNGNIDD